MFTFNDLTFGTVLDSGTVEVCHKLAEGHRFIVDSGSMTGYQALVLKEVQQFWGAHIAVKLTGREDEFVIHLDWHHGRRCPDPDMSAYQVLFEKVLDVYQRWSK